MRDSGSIFSLRRSFFSVLSAAVIAAFASALHAESEGLVKSQPITNNLIPEGGTADQLAAADGFADSGDLDKAITTYRYIAKSAPGSKEAPSAQYRLAKQLNNKGEFEAAFKEYQNLLKKYPQTPDFEQSVADQIEIANAFLKGRRVKMLGLRLMPSMEKAEEMYTAILKSAPYSKHAPVTQFNLGLAFEKQGKAKEAICLPAGTRQVSQQQCLRLGFLSDRLCLPASRHDRKIAGSLRPQGSPEQLPGFSPSVPEQREGAPGR
jgi:tetratricopeptide (TPR) repeat protein